MSALGTSSDKSGAFSLFPLNLVYWFPTNLRDSLYVLLSSFEPISTHAAFCILSTPYPFLLSISSFLHWFVLVRTLYNVSEPLGLNRFSVSR